MSQVKLTKKQRRPIARKSLLKSLEETPITIAELASRLKFMSSARWQRPYFEHDGIHFYTEDIFPEIGVKIYNTPGLKSGWVLPDGSSCLSGHGELTRTMFIDGGLECIGVPNHLT